MYSLSQGPGESVKVDIHETRQANNKGKGNKPADTADTGAETEATDEAPQVVRFKPSVPTCVFHSSEKLQLVFCGPSFVSQEEVAATKPDEAGAEAEAEADADDDDDEFADVKGWLHYHLAPLSHIICCAHACSSKQERTGH